MKWFINGLIDLGSLLMIYNIYGFVKFARYIRGMKNWNRQNWILNIPIILLISFLMGYLAVGFFGDPDIIMAGILFGGSIFVYVMYILLSRITRQIIESEHLAAELSAAEESNRLKTSFLATMSHEMRTPLNAIIGLDTIAMQDESLSPKARDRLEKIDGSARHLLDLIDDVLIMNQLASDGMLLRRTPFSLSKSLDIVNVLIQTGCDEKGLSYQSEIIGDLEDAYLGDGMRLKQALLNILDNAIKFTPEGGSVSLTTEAEGPLPTVAAEAEGPPPGDGRTLRFTIRDTGIGIDPGFLPKIFDSFSQQDASATNRYGGSGLGLSITKKLVEMMGGDITVRSTKGQGSVFTVTVPLERVEQPVSAAEVSRGLAGMRVLIVEDIDLNAEMLADLLDLEDIASERAENGQLAVDMFARNPAGYYDAILMDLRMPVMDGLNATRTIRALDRPDAAKIPIIALTANTFEEDVRQTREAGMDAHLAKPVDADLLYETLGRLAGRGK